MKKFISYLMVFLLGWAGAVWSYSDLIYPKVESSTEKVISEKGTNEKK